MKSARGQKRLNSLLLNGGLALLVIIWLIPVFGLLVSSFRERFAIQTSGWWTIFPHKEWQVVRTIDPKALGLDASAPMQVEDALATFEQLREGVETPGGLRLQWSGNRRLGTIEVQQQVWVMNVDFTLDNYKQVWGGKDFEYKRPDGTVEIIPGDDFSVAVFNSLAVSIPATVIPILIAAFAAYGFAWMSFPGRKALVHYGDRPAGRAAANRPGADLAGLLKARIEWHLPGDLAGAYRLWSAIGDLSVI